MEGFFQLLAIHSNGSSPWLPGIYRLWLVWTLLASAASNGCHCVFVSWIKKCFIPVCNSVISVIHGKQEGYVHGWKSCHPRAALENSRIMQDICWSFSYIHTCARTTLSGWFDPCAHISELRLDTQELLCRRCSSLCPTPVLSHHRSADTSFAPITFWSPLHIAEVSPFHPWALGAHCNLPVSLLLPNLPMQCLLRPSVSVRSFLCADESMRSSRLYSFVFFSSSFITMSALLWRILIESPFILLVGWNAAFQSGDCLLLWPCWQI